RIGEEGRGVPTIIEMVHHTRLDCAVAAVGLQRRALTEALHHARHRKAFGRYLIDQPLMQNVLADLCVEYEANLMMVFRVARAYDEKDTLFARLAVAIAKYWSNKRCAYFVNEAMECLGGAGYIEESILPRLYREAPLNGIWEGSGNVICLDILRTIHKAPDAFASLWSELEKARGVSPILDRELDALQNDLKSREDMVFQARRIVERLALALQASLIARFGTKALFHAFVETRIRAGGGRAFGTLPLGVDISSILKRLEW
ncbi:MAG: acyl-CoA dehydrogenase family protein, partial [Myxococcota bacterium]|nr:acyl-CoA dehydrogenase family protein [Myxococcota bacterium]